MDPKRESESNGGCERFVPKLAEFASAGQDAESDADLAKHLAGCEACRAEMAAMCAARDLLRRPDSIRSPAGLAARTCERIGRSAGVSPASADAAADAAKPHAAVAPARPSFLVRPIRHPAARVAAALLILASILPMAWLDLAERVGRWERHVLGDRLVGHVDVVGERILDLYGGGGSGYLKGTSFCGVDKPQGKT